jgi:hypothetical protein
MSSIQIRERIADFTNRLSGSLATDASFRRELISILDLIRPEGYDVRISVAERGSSTPFVFYRSTSSQDRTDPPSDVKNWPDADRAVRCTHTAWADSRTKITGQDMDAIFRDLAGLINLHWGERDVLTLLPRLQDAGIAPRIPLCYVRYTDHQSGLWQAPEKLRLVMGCEMMPRSRFKDGHRRGSPNKAVGWGTPTRVPQITDRKE